MLYVGFMYRIKNNMPDIRDRKSKKIAISQHSPDYKKNKKKTDVQDELDSHIAFISA